MNNLKIHWNWPKGEFFGIKNFPIDWPQYVGGPSPEFNLSSIIAYASVIVYIYVIFVLLTSTLCFISRLNRARVKSVDVFTKSLDNLDLDGDVIDGEK